MELDGLKTPHALAQLKMVQLVAELERWMVQPVVELEHWMVQPVVELERWMVQPVVLKPWRW
jgi:hypothetical protein